MYVCGTTGTCACIDVCNMDGVPVCMHVCVQLYMYVCNYTCMCAGLKVHVHCACMDGVHDGWCACMCVCAHVCMCDCIETLDTVSGSYIPHKVLCKLK